MQPVRILTERPPKTGGSAAGGYLFDHLLAGGFCEASILQAKRIQQHARAKGWASLQFSYYSPRWLLSPRRPPVSGGGGGAVNPASRALSMTSKSHGGCHGGHDHFRRPFRAPSARHVLLPNSCRALSDGDGEGGASFSATPSYGSPCTIDGELMARTHPAQPETLSATNDSEVYHTTRNPSSEKYKISFTPNADASRAGTRRGAPKAQEIPSARFPTRRRFIRFVVYGG